MAKKQVNICESVHYPDDGEISLDKHLILSCLLCVLHCMCPYAQEDKRYFILVDFG